MQKRWSVMIIIGMLCSITAFAATEKGTIKDSRDGNTYRTAKIGSQVWMAENLNFKTKDSKCNEDVSKNCAALGRMYNWVDAQKACPKGWHLPSEAEFNTLIENAGGEFAGAKLKASKGWGENLDGSGPNTDDFGFTVLPIDNDACFWTSKKWTDNVIGGEFVLEKCFTIEVSYVFGQARSASTLLSSIRCVKD